MELLSVLLFGVCSVVINCVSIEVRTPVVVQMPFKDIELYCNYSTNQPHDDVSVKWQKRTKDGKLTFVAGRSTANTLYAGKEFHKIAYVKPDGCTLVLLDPSEDLSGDFFVTVDLKEERSETEEVRLEVFNEKVFIVVLPEVNLHIPTSRAEMTCSYISANLTDDLRITWMKGEQNESFVFGKDFSGEPFFGDGYKGRVSLGDGCTLIFDKPNVADSGNYRVTVKSKRSREESARVQLQVLNETCAQQIGEICHDQGIVITDLVVDIVCAMLQIATILCLLWYYCKRPHSDQSDSDGTERSGPSGSQHTGIVNGNSDNRPITQRSPGKRRYAGIPLEELSSVVVSGGTSESQEGNQGERQGSKNIVEASGLRRRRGYIHNEGSIVHESSRLFRDAPERRRNDLQGRTEHHEEMEKQESDSETEGEPILILDDINLGVCEPVRLQIAADYLGKPLQVTPQISAVFPNVGISDDPPTSRDNANRRHPMNDEEQNKSGFRSKETDANRQDYQDNKPSVMVMSSDMDSGYASSSQQSDCSSVKHEAGRQLTVSTENNDDAKNYTLNLHVAVRNNDVNMCREVLAAGTDVDAMDGGQTALHLAAEKGLDDIAKLLLKANAKTDILNAGRLTCLQVAVKNGKPEVCRLLIKARCNLNQTDKEGQSLLHSAASSGEEDIAEQLLQNGVKADLLSSKAKLSALHIAAKDGHFAVCQTLINAKCTVDLRDKGGQTALHFAVWKGHQNIARLLLDSGANVNLLTLKTLGCLHMAVWEGHEDLCRLLIERGCDLHQKDTDGDTPLHLASSRGSFELTKLLLDKGAKVDYLNSEKWTSLHVAAKKDHQEVCRLLIDADTNVNSQKKDGFTALHLAALNGHTELAADLLKAGAKTDIETSDGDTPLHLASKKGRLEITKLLLDKGAQVDYLNANGDTPLHMASKKARLEITKLLLDKGAQVDYLNADKWTSLHLAAKKDNPEVCRLLIKAGTNVNSQKEDGFTALHLAALNGHTELAGDLLKAGAKTDIVTHKGDTPLHVAVLDNQLEMVDLLLKSGSPINSHNDNGMAAVHLAILKGNKDILMVLVDAGAKLDLPNTNGDTPLHIAANEGDFEIAEILIEAGAPHDLTNKAGQTALHATMNEKPDMLKELSSMQTSLMDLLTTDKKPRSRQKDQLKVAELLIKAGCDINQKDQNGNGVLHMAAKVGHVENVERLIKAGALVDMSNKVGLTALHLAVKGDHLDLSDMLTEPLSLGDLLKSDKGKKGNRLSVVRRLIDAGCNVNQQNQDGETALHIAAESGNEDMTNILLGAGAKADILDSSLRHSPLQPAAREGHVNVCRQLIKAGCNVNHPDKMGQTALHYAVWKGHLSTVDILLEAGARTDIHITEENSSCLHTASKKNHVDVCQRLIKAGCNLDVQETDGNTPLHLATMPGHKEITEMLLKEGARTDLKNTEGKTPLDLARESGREDIVILFEQKDAQGNQ